MPGAFWGRVVGGTVAPGKAARARRGRTHARTEEFSAERDGRVGRGSDDATGEGRTLVACSRGRAALGAARVGALPGPHRSAPLAHRRRPPSPRPAPTRTLEPAPERPGTDLGRARRR